MYIYIYIWILMYANYRYDNCKISFFSCFIFKTWKSCALGNTPKWLYDHSNTPYLDHQGGTIVSRFE